MPQKMIPPIVGWIVFGTLIFLAQRDLRRRAPESVRGNKTVWRFAAVLPPGAIAYLIFGRRKGSEGDEGASTASDVA